MTKGATSKERVNGQDMSSLFQSYWVISQRYREGEEKKRRKIHSPIHGIISFPDAVSCDKYILKINVCLEHMASSTTSYLGLHSLLIVGILKNMTSTNSIIYSSEQQNCLVCLHFGIYEVNKFQAQKG